jgi:tetratricopeptide (TPR) repeat protein
MGTNYDDKFDLASTLEMAVGHHQSGEFDLAEGLYRAILQRQPRNAEANHNLGVLAIQTNRAPTGVEYLRLALEAAPGQAQYWVSYIDALLRINQAGLARECLEHGRRVGLQGAVVDALEARIKAPSDVTASAPLQAAKASVFRPDDVSAHAVSTEPTEAEMRHLASLYNSGEYDAALAEAKSLVGRFPCHGFGWKVLGAVYQEQGQLELSVDAKSRACELLPMDAEAHSNLGNARREQGKFNEAEPLLRKAIALDPSHAEAHNNLGETLRGLGRLTEAEACLLHALRLRPKFAQAYNNLGLVFLARGRLSEAEESYRRALEIRPDYAEAQKNLGDVYFYGPSGIAVGEVVR